MEEEDKKPTSKTISLIIALVGLLIVLAIVLGGAMLAGRAWDPKWNPFRPKIENM